jgi:hypothetical protein
MARVALGASPPLAAVDSMQAPALQLVRARAPLPSAASEDENKLREEKESEKQ